MNRLISNNLTLNSILVQNSNIMNSINRRNFSNQWQQVTVPQSSHQVVPGKDAPSNKITVGFIGTGGHGTG